MLDPVATFAGAADFAGLGLPHGAVIMLGSHDGVGDFVEYRILDLGAGGSQAIADRQVNALFDITADAGARSGEIKTECPPCGQVSPGLKCGHEVITQDLNVGQGAFWYRGVDHRPDSRVRHPPLDTGFINCMDAAGSD